jgi:hypothetical protein
MDIRLIDRSRNVTIVPRSGPPFGDDLFGVLDDMMRDMIVSMRSAKGEMNAETPFFVADREFIMALNVLDRPGRLPHYIMMEIDGEPVQTYCGVRMMVEYFV